MHRLSLPLIVQTGVKDTTTFSLNLNTYRNAHYLTLNKAKIAFKEAVADLIAPLPVFEEVQFAYEFFPGSAREIDTMNFACIVDKFFSDAFVELGKLPDDNYKFLTSHSAKFVEIDRKNPRMDVIITGKAKPVQTLTQYILDQEEIANLVLAHILSINPNAKVTSEGVSFKSSRGAELTATLSVTTSTNGATTIQQQVASAGSLMERLDAQPEGTNGLPVLPSDEPAKATPAPAPEAAKGGLFDGPEDAPVINENFIGDEAPTLELPSEDQSTGLGNDFMSPSGGLFNL